MLYFTKQEQKVLTYLGFIFLIGTSLNFAFKSFPHLNNIVNVVESDRIYRGLDLNRATEEELEKLPYIGEKTAQRIIEYRARKGRFNSVEEIRNIKGINKAHFEKFRKYLKINKGHGAGVKGTRSKISMEGDNSYE